MKVRLSKWQLEVANDNHRFKVICAGRRSGKSVLARLTLLKWATENVGTYYLVSPSYRQAKSIHWNDIRREIPRDWVVKTNETELSITLKNGSVIELKGAENPDALRGVKLRGLVIDEIASIRNWDWLWQEVLRPTLTDYSAPAIFISTPKGFNHFHDLYLLGQNNNEGDASSYRSWRFTSYDNPYIPKEEIDNAKKELTEDTFAQEYLADFRRFTGLAITQFERGIHVIEPFEVPREWQRARGFDYGSKDPTASLRVAIDNDNNWFVERCYKQRGSTIQEHANTILSQDYGLGFIPIYGDPSGDQWEREFDQYNLHITSASKETGQNAQGYVAFTIEAINERLKPIPGHTVNLPNGKTITNAPRLFFLNTPEVMMLVKEIELLKWKETAQGQTLPILDEYVDPDGHSDLTACLRYLIVSYKKPAVYYNDQPKKNWTLA
jgi:hypothetical protein